MSETPETTTRRPVSLSTSLRSGLTFYVVSDPTEGYIVYVGQLVPGPMANSMLYKRELLGWSRSEPKEYTVIYNGHTIVIDPVTDCTQLNVDDYDIKDHGHGVEFWMKQK